MTFKNKFKYYFLLIASFGLIKRKWRKYRQEETKKYLSVSNKLDFDIKTLIGLLGSKENITNAQASQKKIKISLKNIKNVNVDEIQKLEGVSGLFLQSNAITLITGNNAKYVEELISKEIN
ncbi:PTS glucose transporter subunit IIB [[Mycoplasma] gypis]|uniref:PTS glucose transporter subunit IIB n=1 Tax=[Mycoplasma] gypis TaxID=92404 RepID=A0ABZ2RQG9_9BACT|nr:PTS glucose transporter subunit IIB [[Mycoplasma] gypis]MBN0919508.1 PTS glucose transporter subunit IIB [[Mycoplasma] gypis]